MDTLVHFCDARKQRETRGSTYRVKGFRQISAVLAIFVAGLIATASASAGIGKVVALGDSSAAGNGLGSQIVGSPGFCERTSGGYPELAMAQVAHTAFSNQTCSGATTQALFYGGTVSGVPVAAQTAVLDSTVDVVILSIGDNNAGFGEVTNNCVAHLSSLDSDVCTSTYGTAGSNLLPAKATTGITTDTNSGFAPSVGHSLERIHALSPNAKIFLVGYLRIAPPDGESCNTPFNGTYQRSYLNLTPNDAPVFAAWEDAVDSALTAQSAGKPYAHFVDIQPASTAHNACNPSGTRWVNGLQNITPDAMVGDGLHPSPDGASAVANALIDAMNTAGLNTEVGPAVTISSPADGSYVTASSATLTYSVVDTLGTPSCTPASGSTVDLSTGANTITVSCEDTAGKSGSASVTVNRGSTPVVALTSPSDGLNTTSSATNVSYTVDGGTTLPSKGCKVNATNSTSATTNALSLSTGANAIQVSCTNDYGTGTSAPIVVNRGSVPAVAITAPIGATTYTTSDAVNLAYTVGGTTTLPPGGCTVNGTTSTSATTNSVALDFGANSIQVACANAFGTGYSQTITVNRGTAPVVAIESPNDGVNTTASSENLTYTVNGGAAIPNGTTCTVAGAASSTPNSNSVALDIGANTIAARCVNPYGSSEATVVINRGVVPVVTIVAPAANSWTSSDSVNVSFVVNGSGAIPSGTTCTVNESAATSATANPVSLNPGPNAISVHCSSDFGSSEQSVTVKQGDGPVVAITAPTNGLATAAESINVSFTVRGSASIAGGTTCKVSGTTTTSATSNSVALSLGPNTVTVSCENEVGTDERSIAVNRGNPPTVAIGSPADGAKTVAQSINIAYTVDGSATIPAETTCFVNGSESGDTASNAVSLGTGVNLITATCQNVYGVGETLVSVIRELPVEPIPTDPSKVQVSPTNLSKFSPARKGKPFILGKRAGGGNFTVTLGRTITVHVRIEQVLEGRRFGAHCRATTARSARKKEKCTAIRNATGWYPFALQAGTSMLHVSGRSAKHALAPGRYRVRLKTDDSAALYAGKSFRIER